MSFHTVKEADEAAEGLKTWREGMTVRRMHPPESVGGSHLYQTTALLCAEVVMLLLLFLTYTKLFITIYYTCTVIYQYYCNVIIY